VSHFSEAHHNWTQQGRTPRSPIFDHHQTPTDTSSAHPPSRCVPTTTPSPARRSTPARCVLKFTPRRRVWEEIERELCDFNDDDPRHDHLTPTHLQLSLSRPTPARFAEISLRTHTTFIAWVISVSLILCVLLVLG
jgi:hypothetical protein